jgi:hypothetical protein
MTGYVPKGVLADLMVRIVEQLGEQPVTENDALVLAGRPERLNDTVLGVPERRTVLILVVAVDAWPTDKSAGRESEKSKFPPELVIPALAATSIGVKATLEI